MRAGGTDHIGDGVLAHLLARDGAEGPSDAGPQQFEVVVNFCDRPHRRAAAARGDLLFDGDGRGEVVDSVDVGLFKPSSKLTDIGAQGLDVPPLSFGVERVEGQRAFA